LSFVGFSDKQRLFVGSTVSVIQGYSKFSSSQKLQFCLYFFLSEASG